MYAAQNMNDEKDTHDDTHTLRHTHTLTHMMSHMQPVKHGNILSARVSKQINNAPLHCFPPDLLSFRNNGLAIVTFDTLRSILSPCTPQRKTCRVLQSDISAAYRMPASRKICQILILQCEINILSKFHQNPRGSIWGSVWGSVWGFMFCLHPSPRLEERVCDDNLLRSRPIISSHLEYFLIVSLANLNSSYTYAFYQKLSPFCF